MTLWVGIQGLLSVVVSMSGNDGDGRRVRPRLDQTSASSSSPPPRGATSLVEMLEAGRGAGPQFASIVRAPDGVTYAITYRARWTARLRKERTLVLHCDHPSPSLSLLRFPPSLFARYTGFADFGALARSTACGVVPEPRPPRFPRPDELTIR